MQGVVQIKDRWVVRVYEKRDVCN